MTFKRQILRGSLWSVFGNSGQQVIGFVLFIYIARLVTPADVGLVAFAMVLVSILTYVSRFGQVQALQREVNLSDLTINTSFWLLAVSGFVTTALVLIAAETAPFFSNEPKLPFVLLLLAPVCAFQAWNAVPEAILRRRLDYRSLSFRSWLAGLTGGLIGLLLAQRGYGVFALVAQRLATVVVQTAAAWGFLYWYPRFIFAWQEARRLGIVGTEIMLASFAGMVTLRITDGLTGLLLGATELGYLRLGWRFFEVIQQVGSNPVTNVSLTAFAHARHDMAAFNRIYFRLSQFLACSSLPLFFGLAATADVMVPLVFGEQWVDSVVVLQMLCLLSLAGTVNSFFAPAMIAIGESRLLLRQATIQVFMTAIFVAVGAQFGIVGVMAAFIARAVMIAAYNLRELRRHIDLDIGRLLRILVPPVIGCLVMVAVVELLKPLLPASLGEIVRLAALVLAGAVTYGLVLVSGDVLGLWRGYVGDAVRSIRSGARS
jgi:O-antigen/teichoic acid export membrane protein